jgi:hypothetical protein
MGRRVRARINDEDRLDAIEAAAEEHGSLADAMRHAIDVAYCDTGTDDDDVGSTIAPDLSNDLRDGYTALVDRYGTDSRIALDTAKSVIAQATQTPAESTENSVIEPLRQRGYLGVNPGRRRVTVIIPERTATDGGEGR